ncbi:MAG: AAA family ATPase [Eubacteriales bacterium]|nr:AAA family ATPase [Eubacteriales bacterium]
MFSVNIDKLTDMTESEKESYDILADSFLEQYEDKCHTLAFIEGGIKAFKIAAAIMERNKKVLFIDGDVSCDVFLGKYKLGKNLKGIMDYITLDFPDLIVLEEMICGTNHENMDIVFTGVLNDKQVTMQEEAFMEKLIKAYQEKYDYIIMDSDKSGVLAKYCDGTLVIIDECDYSELSAQKLTEELEINGCKVLGVIINE